MGSYGINMGAPLLVSSLMIIIFESTFLIFSVTSFEADDYPRMDRRYMNWKCHNQCSDDCDKKYDVCELNIHLLHCYNVCRLLCSFEAPEPPRSTV